MSAATYNISLEQGVDYSLAITLQNGSGGYLPLTGATFMAEIAHDWTSDAFASFTVTVVNAATGSIKMSMNAATTFEIPVGTHQYGLLYTYSGVNTSILEGTVTMSPNVNNV